MNNNTAAAKSKRQTKADLLAMLEELRSHTETSVSAANAARTRAEQAVKDWQDGDHKLRRKFTEVLAGGDRPRSAGIYVTPPSAPLEWEVIFCELGKLLARKFDTDLKDAVDSLRYDVQQLQVKGATS